MERDITELKHRLVNESNPRNDLILFAIFDCQLNGTIKPEDQLLSSNALHLIIDTIGGYLLDSSGDLSQDLLRPAVILSMMEEFYKSVGVNFNPNEYKKTWPKTPNEVEAASIFLEDIQIRLGIIDRRSGYMFGG